MMDITRQPQPPTPKSQLNPCSDCGAPIAWRSYAIPQRYCGSCQATFSRFGCQGFTGSPEGLGWLIFPQNTGFEKNTGLKSGLPSTCNFKHPASSELSPPQSRRRRRRRRRLSKSEISEGGIAIKMREGSPNKSSVTFLNDQKISRNLFGAKEATATSTAGTEIKKTRTPRSNRRRRNQQGWQVVGGAKIVPTTGQNRDFAVGQQANPQGKRAQGSRRRRRRRKNSGKSVSNEGHQASQVAYSSDVVTGNAFNTLRL